MSTPNPVIFQQAISQLIAETGIAPLNVNYQPIDAFRYGAVGDGVTDDTSAIMRAVSVVSVMGGGEIWLRAGYTFLVSQVAFASINNWRLRVDGILKSSRNTVVGTAFADERSTYQGQYSPLKITSCTGFKVHGIGSINPGYAEPAFITSCSKWEWTLDCVGTGQNSTLAGLWTQYCDHFSIHDCVIDSITAQNMNNATEVYYSWLNNVFFLSDTFFRVYNVESRRAGMNGLYFGSDCSQFAVSTCLLEYNSGSAAQFTWSSYGTNPPTHYSVTNVVTQYNQADGFDFSNTNGSQVPIYATITGCAHTYNGWCNCNPANAGGSDGSGLGTFFNISFFECVGCTAYEPNNAGIALQNASNFRISNFAISKTNAGGSQEGIAILSPVTYGTIENGDVITAGLQTIDMQSASDVILSKIRATGGPCSFATGTYNNCKMKECSISSTTTVNWVFDIIDSEIIVTGSGQGGLIANQSGVCSIRNGVSAPSQAINTNTQNYCVIEDGSYSTSSGSSATIGVNSSAATRVEGVMAINTGTGAAFQTTGTCDRTFLANLKANSTSSNSLNTSSGSTNTILMGLTNIAGTASLGGTYLISQP